MVWLVLWRCLCTGLAQSSRWRFCLSYTAVSRWIGIMSFSTRQCRCQILPWVISTIEDVSQRISYNVDISMQRWTGKYRGDGCTGFLSCEITPNLNKARYHSWTEMGYANDLPKRWLYSSSPSAQKFIEEIYSFASPFGWSIHASTMIGPTLCTTTIVFGLTLATLATSASYNTSRQLVVSTEKK